MKNSLYKKGIVLVFMVVFLLTVPSTFATFTPNVVKTLKNNTGEDLPDLVILDIKEGQNYMYWFLYADVLNDGDGEVPAWTDRTLRCVVIRPMTNKKVLDTSDRWPNCPNPAPPGERVSGFWLWDCEPSTTFGLCKLYFEVDPGNAIAESNENNNVVWAYYILHLNYATVSPTRLTPLQQVSKIPASMPLNIP